MIERLVATLSRRRGATLAILGLLTAASLFSILRRPLSSNVLELLPLKDRVIARHYDFLSTSGMMQQIVVELSRADSTLDFAALVATARETEQILSQSGLVDTAGRIDASEMLMLRNQVLVNWPNLFGPDDSAWVVQRLRPDSVSARLHSRLGALFMLGDASVDAFSVRNDPFGLAEYSLRKLAAFKPVEDVFIDEGYVTNRERSRILLLVRTRSAGSDEAGARSVAATLGECTRAAEKRGVSLEWMGAARATLDNVDTIKRDVNYTAPVALVLILCMCLLIYRRWYYGLLVFIPTVIGIIVTLGLFSILRSISLIVLGFGAALLGITVDYAVHYLYHADDMGDGKDAVSTLAPPILASALTTAGAFAVLVIAGIPGLAQLGSVTAVGILLVALLSIIVLPAVMRPVKERSERTAPIRPAVWFEHFYARGVHRKLLVPVVLLGIVLWMFAGRLSFDGDPAALNGMLPATEQAERDLEEHWRGLSQGTFLVAGAPTRDEAVSRAYYELAPFLDSAIAVQRVMPAHVFTDLLPPPDAQERSRARWRATFGPAAVALMRTALRDVTRGYGLDAAGFEQYLSAVAKGDSLPPLRPESFSPSIQKTLFGNWLHESNGRFYASVAVFPAGDTSWNSLARDAEKAGLLAVNDAVLGERVVEIVRAGFVRCVIYIPAVVLLVLVLMFRSLVIGLLALVPSALATGITLGTMALTGLSVNIISLMIFAFIFGLGIDYTILILHLHTLDAQGRQKVCAHGAASVTVAAATTLAGLGILAVARHPVLASVGKTGLVGIVASYACAIVCVPALAAVGRWWSARKNRFI